MNLEIQKFKQIDRIKCIQKRKLKKPTYLTTNFPFKEKGLSAPIKKFETIKATSKENCPFFYVALDPQFFLPPPLA